MKSTIRQKYVTLALLLGLSVGFIVSSCSKSSSGSTPVVTTSLAAEIDTAQNVIATTTEGTQAGEYTVGSKATLNAAITSAQSVLNSSSSTQSDITNATANLAAAVAAYRGNIILQIDPASLVAYWKFNGNANDSSGNNHNGTLEAGPVGLAAVPGGVPTLTKDRFQNPGVAYHFAGGGNIDVPFSPSLNPKQMTISLWCRQDTAGRTDHPNDCYMISLSRWNGWKFQTQPTLPFLTVSTDTSIYDTDDAGTAIAIGTVAGTGPWNHLAVTYDGVNTMNFYINGTLVKTQNKAKGAIKPINPTYDLSIGSDLVNSAYSTDMAAPNYIGYGGYWTGDLDDIMIYNVALTATQVTSLYNQQKSQ
jgi:hypothetical protein